MLTCLRPSNLKTSTLQVGNDIVLRLEFIKERQMKVSITRMHNDGFFEWRML